MTNHSVTVTPLPLREEPGSPPNHPAGRRGRAVLSIPLVLVNAVAVWGQAGWAYTHVTDPTWPFLARFLLALGFAAAIESIGVYLAWEAHQALMADRASGLIRSGSLAVGVLAGWLNFEHFFAGGELSRAVAFGCLSAISPVLWAVWSYGRNWVRLKTEQHELGRSIDPRGVKLSTARKILHPVRSFRLIRWAAWEGITDPVEAVRGWELAGALADAEAEPDPEPVPAPVPPARTRAGLAAEARQLMAEQPNITRAEIARRLGVSVRWLRIALNGAGS